MTTLLPFADRKSYFTCKKKASQIYNGFCACSFILNSVHEAKEKKENILKYYIIPF